MNITEKINKYLGESSPSSEYFKSKVPDSTRKIQLRVMTMDDVMNNTLLTDLHTVTKGTWEDIEIYVRKKNLIWKNSPSQLFGGYWYERKSGKAYLPT
jgi:hypothetical protein